MARAGRCPTCGEPVSQFAAGCAICGTDLEEARAQRRSRPTARAEEVGRRLRPSFASDAFFLAILAFLVLFAPFVAVLVGALIAFDAFRKGDERRRNVALVAIVVAIALTFVGFSPAYELLSRL